VVGSVFNAFRGRLPVRNLLQNWAAAAKLPLIQIGLAQDIWRGFDRYVDIEKGRPSTFFVIPFEGTPGINQKGPAPRKRAARYDVSHVTPQIARLTSAGCEIGLHGIDAWIDSVRGQEEAKRISAFSGNADIGVRMHWLYRSAESPAHLEKAGFSYDSTVGYNETVGFRAGTGQAFKPLNATRLLELPMQAMDTALFFSHYLDLSPDDAWRRLEALLDIATSRGGAVTVNWHDRSISPERLWGDLYSRLIAGMTVKGAWFGSASQTIAWFRQRRAITFHRAGNRIEARVPGESRPDIPPCRLRVYPGSSSGASIAATAAKDRNGYVDMPLRENHTI
jgi:hypothetical protein